MADEITRARQQKEKKGKPHGVLHGILVVILSIIIVLLAFGGAFYYVLKNDINGLGERFRPGLERVPILKLALPELPESEDPYDPKRLTQREIIEYYNQLRSIKAELTEQLESANKRIAELENEKKYWVKYKEDAEEIHNKNKETLEQIQEEIAQMEIDKKHLDTLIAMGDTEGFSKYFEKVDGENAKELYSQILVKEVEKQNLKELAATYAEMEPANAAAILTEIGNTDKELVVDLIEAMKRDVKAEIIENMDPKFSAEILKIIATRKLSG